MYRHYGQPAARAGASAVSTWPVGAAPGPNGVGNAAATMKRVRRSAPPSAQAKQPRSSEIASSTSPPSRTRTQQRAGTSAYQTAPSVSRQMPSGWLPGAAVRSAQTRRLARRPSDGGANARIGPLRSGREERRQRGREGLRRDVVRLPFQRALLGVGED